MGVVSRRTLLKSSLGVTASLAGLGGLAGCGDDSADIAQSLFPGEPDPPDLSAPNEMPPTEIPNPGRFFGADQPFQGPIPATPTSFLGTFEHVVVLQLENRSLDNLLGYLYPTGISPNGDAFNGVSPGNYSNPIPAYAPDAQRLRVPVTRCTGLLNPAVDPAEQWTAVNLALYNQFNPPANQTAKLEADFAAPYNLPATGATFPAPMDGFVTAFYWRLLSMNKPATYDNYSTVMQCFPPNLVPAFSLLAQANAVCDRWHCAVPSQTYTNRCFFHAASSSGFLVNSPSSRWIFDNDAPTIFESLTDAGKAWTIYYDKLDIAPLTRYLHFPQLKKFPNTAPYFKGMTEFYDDVENGTLPAYSFIQPRFLLDTNSYHPDKGAPAVKRGEILVNDIYQAIRQSNSVTGSNYLNTLLVVTFDEGGTTFDHVPPPAATSPDGTPGQYGFVFDRLGQRIPTVLVSPWLAAGSVISKPLDANSLMRTLQQKFGLPTLNNRDAASSSLADIAFLPTPRSRADLPRLRLRKLSAEEAASDGAQPPGEMAGGLVNLVNAANGGGDATPPGVTVINDCLAFLRTSNLA
jgi:phospholipase C